MLETVFEKIGTPYKKEEFAERLELAKYWLEKCSPENMNTLLGYRNWDFYNTLNEVEKKEIQLLHDFIAKGEYDLDALNSFIYTIPREADPDFQEENKKTAQAQFFKNAYNLMIGKAAGPRLYLFLFAVEPQRYLGLLDFSTPQTEEEKTLAAEAKAEAERKAAEEEARRKAAEEEEARKNAIAPIKEEITIDEFDKVNPAFYNAFYELFDEGRYVDTNYDVNLGQAIFLLTCNFGSEEEIKKILGPAMFSRIGCCIAYEELSTEQKQTIVHNWYESILSVLKADEKEEIEKTDILDWFIKNAERYDNIRILKTKLENAIFDRSEVFIIS